MNRIVLSRTALVAAFLVGAGAWSACASDDDDESLVREPPTTEDAGVPTTDAGAAAPADAAAATDAPTTLSQAEIDFLTFAREEEKLARDVYLALDGTYPIFGNIAASEQNHMDAVLVVLQRYGVRDPAEGKANGEFTNAMLAQLYDDLVSRGSQSTLAAVQVGLTIEELDIRDLTDAGARMTRADIRTLVDNLLRASRNHLRAFYQQLVALGGTYSPQYLDEETFLAIATSPMERGGPPGF